MSDGVAFVGGTDTIAGSTATMDRVVRFAVAHCGLEGDEALMLAVRQASLNPARALGLPGERPDAGRCSRSRGPGPGSDSRRSVAPRRVGAATHGVGRLTHAPRRSEKCFLRQRSALRRC